MSVLDKPKKAEPEQILKRPVWEGPSGDGPNGGITQGLLSRFLVCRERFRILVVEGLKPTGGFNHRIEFGSMWHACEESLAKGSNPNNREDQWPILIAYCRHLCQKYPTQQQQIDHWYNVCRVQFPLYVEWWARHPDVTDRRPLLQEQVFDVPYRLSSGRAVRLRGKWDSVDLIGTGTGAGIYLQENKTKGAINEVQLVKQLRSGFDLQTMLYLVALKQHFYTNSPTAKEQRIHNGVCVFDYPLCGVRYNVVRRPLSGGKGSITQHKSTKSNPKGESSAAFYARLGGIIKEDPAYFFVRWKVDISAADITRFRKECLDPILENLCDWWGQLTDTPTKPVSTTGGSLYETPLHWRHPFGVYNILDEGGSSDLDEYLRTGSEIGLERTDNLFPELAW